MQKSPAVKDALSWGAKKLKKIDGATLDASVLLCAALGKPKEFIYTYPEKKLTPAQAAKYKKFIGRRAKHEPAAYILGKKEFYGFEFAVAPSVLIPRPDTETLINTVLKTIGLTISNSYPYVIDVGTGSGAIAITLQKLLPKAQVFASDINPRSLALAKKNARRLVPQKAGLNAKIIFRKGYLLSPFKSLLAVASLPAEVLSATNPNGFSAVRGAGQPLIITANLPYLSRAEWQKTAPEIKKYEPYGALVGGKTGTEIYEKLFKELAVIFSPSIVEGLYYKKTISTPSTALRSAREIILFIEIGYNQKPAIAKLAKKILNPKKIEFYKDLGKKWRVAKISI